MNHDSINTSTLDTISARITLTPGQQILPMIEQRIRDEIEPRAQQAEKDLIAIISIELGKLGINPSLTGTHAYARGIADNYRERLVGERIEAIVDGLVAKPIRVFIDCAGLCRQNNAGYCICGDSVSVKDGLSPVPQPSPE